MSYRTIKMGEKYEMITVLGHTAGGKTALAARIAAGLGGAVISADSRQVYRGMTIGTGKDLDDYVVEGKRVSSYLIDIIDAGKAYNVFEFRKDFHNVFEDLKRRDIFPIFCGGTGMYLESVLRNYSMVEVPENKLLRKDMEEKSLEDLEALLRSYKVLHNKSDTDNRKRTIRAIEIAQYQEENDIQEQRGRDIRSLVVGIRYERDERRERITSRLRERLDEGMVQEVEALLAGGVSNERLEYYGLEYKYLSKYLRGELSYAEMFSSLNTAIHRFAKRQMTYFRGMERRGVKIHWIEGHLSLDEKVKRVYELFELPGDIGNVED